MGDEEPDVDDGDEVAADVAASDAADVEDIVTTAQLTMHLDSLTASESKLGQLSIAKVESLICRSVFENLTCLKLRTLANKIINSPTIIEDLDLACQQAEIESKLMVRDVSTHWNSTAELIQRALELKEALKILVAKADYNKPRGVRLARFNLSMDEWRLLEQLSPLLDVCISIILCLVLQWFILVFQIFLFATKEISKSSTPLIHEVIPIFDVITSALDEFIDNIELEPIVRHAALRGMLMLNKYYALTDDSIVYRIAMSTVFSFLLLSDLLLTVEILVLHPRYKMTYFTKAGWERDWITTAEHLAKTEWAANYNIVAATSEPQSGITEAGESSNVCANSRQIRCLVLRLFKRFSAARKYFDVLKDKSAPIDALEEWISSPIITTSLDPIAYWTSMDVAGHKLARMALDYLSIPGTLLSTIYITYN
jgi:hypothetical protein